MNIIQTNLSFGSMSYGNLPNALVYHHAEASKCSVYDVHQWHKENGWAGIGYHYFVRKDGSIYKGRPNNAIGSHCLHHNTNTLGICAEGNYMIEHMPEVQKQALVELGQYLKSIYPIRAVYGHRELMATECPGTNYPLQEIKQAVMKGVQALCDGWHLINGIWFYFENKKKVINGWRKDSKGLWYFLGGDGAMVTSRWIKSNNGYWYFLKSDGAMATNQWIKWNNKSYYIGPDGIMTANTIVDGWVVGPDGAWNGKPQIK
ncbi:N-acetylmuramoyl-L-alanine amidase [Clostridium sp. JN-9]|uniref:N-acetylmuramoyl-L-alanine amidase n=1 Tax=Clostridium sp. JN-9 TaxID=2507159 RepID=UPI000FFDFE2D|nr:N-acetylmuramoyl-L-alanine amidase [Clostridium sp. JN-9]QAT40816.1 N-acetylmuramoyl-L-alanine amidase [Clostridium sp. JN-9]